MCRQENVWFAVSVEITNQCLSRVEHFRHSSNEKLLCVQHKGVVNIFPYLDGGFPSKTIRIRKTDRLFSIRVRGLRGKENILISITIKITVCDRCTRFTAERVPVRSGHRCLEIMGWLGVIHFHLRRLGHRLGLWHRFRFRLGHWVRIRHWIRLGFGYGLGHRFDDDSTTTATAAATCGQRYREQCGCCTGRKKFAGRYGHRNLPGTRPFGLRRATLTARSRLHRSMIVRPYRSTGATRA